MHWAHRISWIIVVVVIVLPANVFAQVPENVRTVIAQLSSQEQQKVRQGYLALAALDTSAAEACLPTANRVLARGLPVPLAITAIRALGDVGHVTSSRSIRAYLMHRHVEVRRGAPMRGRVYDARCRMRMLLSGDSLPPALGKWEPKSMWVRFFRLSIKAYKRQQRRLECYVHPPNVRVLSRAQTAWGSRSFRRGFGKSCFAPPRK